MIEPIVKRIAGLDVHKMVVVGTVLIEEEDGSIKQETREFGTFKRDRQKWPNFGTKTPSANRTHYKINGQEIDVPIAVA